MGERNHFTDSVDLIISNDYGQYTHWQARAREVFVESFADATLTRLDRARYALGDEMREWYEQEAEEAMGAATDVIRQLLSSALQEVDWQALADDIYEDIDKLELDSLTADE